MGSASASLRASVHCTNFVLVISQSEPVDDTMNDESHTLLHSSCHYYTTSSLSLVEIVCGACTYACPFPWFMLGVLSQPAVIFFKVLLFLIMCNKLTSLRICDWQVDWRVSSCKGQFAYCCPCTQAMLAVISLPERQLIQICTLTYVRKWWNSPSMR